MKIDRIQPEGMSVRIRQGKPAYSHVVTVTGPGKTIYIAGQLARDTEGSIVGPGNMRAQLEQTFKNLDACLKAAGATWADVVKTNTFVTDYQAFSQCSDVRMRYFGIASPTSTTIQISGLAQPEAMVESEMIRGDRVNLTGSCPGASLRSPTYNRPYREPRSRSMTTRRAACSCGQLHLAIEGEPSRISMCHCLECQRRTGA